MPSPKPNLRDSRALLRQIEDAERLVRVEVGLTHLAGKMDDHTAINKTNNEAVLRALDDLSKKHDALKWRVLGLSAVVGAGVTGVLSKGNELWNLITGAKQ